MIKWIKKVWHELGQNIFVGERLKNNITAITIVSIISALFGIVMTIINILHQSGFVIATSILFFVSGTISAIASGIFKARKVSVIVTISTCALIFTYYLISGSNDGFSIVWATIMPIGVSYFLSVRSGIIISTYYELLCIIFFYTPLREHMKQFYSEEVMTRYPLVFIVLATFTAIAMVQYHRMVLRDNEYTNRLNEEVKKQTHVANERAMRLEKISDEIVNTLAIAIDAKDKYTNGHSFRVATYSASIAKNLGWNEEDINIIRREAMLHDIGKIGVSDAVLNKPGKLDQDEFEIIKSHTTIGGKILDASENLSGAADVARFHHERYDGTGYPFGLKGEKIPLHARIVSIADAYDAMRSNRIYRKGLSPELIRKELVEGRGEQFDPNLLDVFLKMFDSKELDSLTDIANKQLTSAIGLGLIAHNKDLDSYIQNQNNN